MRILRKITSVFKWIGIILLVLSVVFMGYSLANTGSNWAAVKAQLSANSVETGFADRVEYSTVMFDSMAWAEMNKKQPTRNNTVAANFSYLQDMVVGAADVKEAADFQKLVQYMTSSFDSSLFTTRYEKKEEQEELRRANEAISALDALKPAPGKKVPAGIKISCAADMEAAYASVCAEHAEEAGSYAEYLETVLALMNEAGANDAAAFVKTLDWDTYKAALTVLQNTERTQDSSINDIYFDMLEAGDSDYAAFFTRCKAELASRYPNEPLPADSVIAQGAIKCLEAANYDGSWSALLDSVKAVASSRNASSFSAFLKEHAANLVSAADERAVIGFISLFWWVVARRYLLLIAGIILVAIHIITIKVTDRLLMNRMSAADVEKDDDMLLRVEHLCQYFRSGSYVTKAVDDVSFYIKKGEVFGLVGESGCGKTTTGRTIINLYDPTAGDVWFEGLRISSNMNGLPVYKKQKRSEFKTECARLKGVYQQKIAAEPTRAAELKQELRQTIADMRKKLAADIRKADEQALQSYVEKSKCTELYRLKRKQAITAEFEKKSVGLSGSELEELKHRYEIEMKVASQENIMSRMQMIFQDPVASINPRMTVREIIAEGLRIRGITDKKYINEKVNEMLNLVGLVPEHADRYPHEFSGGQKQRIGIARAIIMEPDLIIADEPISALDVSIQAQVINLLNELRDNMGLTIMFIAHNLSVVKYFSDRIGVMYFGHLVELADSDELFAHPLHPYTRSLLSAIPCPDPHYEKTRKRISYNPNREHDYSVDKPVLREITPGHFINCNEAEFEKYKKELGI